MNNTVNALLDAKPDSVEKALELNIGGKTLNEILIDTTATIGEKITLRRFKIIEKTDNQLFGVYKHMGGRITSVCVLENSTSDTIAKDIAMQVASMNPTYISRDHMPADIVEHERKIQKEIMNNDESFSNKTEAQLNGILEGRLSKSLQDMSLVDQVYFKDGKTKCLQVLKEANTSVVTFVRYEVGEGIEKRSENFADEVAKASQV